MHLYQTQVNKIFLTIAFLLLSSNLLANQTISLTTQASVVATCVFNNQQLNLDFGVIDPSSVFSTALTIGPQFVSINCTNGLNVKLTANNGLHPDANGARQLGNGVKTIHYQLCLDNQCSANLGNGDNNGNPLQFTGHGFMPGTSFSQGIYAKIPTSELISAASGTYTDNVLLTVEAY